MRFCVECGKETEKLFDGLCAECASKHIEVKLPETITLEVCRDCGARKKGNLWVEEEDKDPLKDVILENLTFERSAQLEEIDVKSIKGDPYLQLFEVSVILNAFGIEIKREKKIEVKVKYALCPSCGKKHGGYYEAKLQLRGKIPDGWEDYITEAYAEDVKGGIDLYFPSLSEEKEVVKKIRDLKSAEKKESKKLHTAKDGKRIYKYTTLLRFDEGSDNSRKQKRRKRG
ncbi:MAG: NMD3-related protein [Candidatus Thermoplasmatota archaeon]|nr:NMD3-related protein [Candidatus Thermoplasmatota archaeon]